MEAMKESLFLFKKNTTILGFGVFYLVHVCRYRRTDEERVRCFLVKETKRGIQVAQSSSPSCHTDLHSSLAAHRTFKAQPHEILFRLKI
jgi:hypothetical protein